MRLIIALVAGGLSLATIMGAVAQNAGLPAFRGGVEPFQPRDPARDLPALSFTDGDGRPLTLDNFRGRVVLLNLWATWCPPCVEEMPALDRLQAALGGDAFEVVALSIDRPGRRVVEPFMQRYNLTRLRLFLDPSGASVRALQVQGLPTTLLIDREGREIGRMAGAAAWDSPAGQALMRAAIARPGPSPGAAPPTAPAARPTPPAAPAPAQTPSRPALDLDEFQDDRRPAPNDGTRAESGRSNRIGGAE